VPYFCSYDLRHTCATLLLYEGRTLNEVAEHLTSCATPPVAAASRSRSRSVRRERPLAVDPW
jgi:integrase